MLYYTDLCSQYSVFDLLSCQGYCNGGRCGDCLIVALGLAYFRLNLETMQTCHRVQVPKVVAELRLRSNKINFVDLSTFTKKNGLTFHFTITP